MKVIVKWSDGTMDEFKSRKEAAKAILAAFAESGQNPVDEAWEETPDGSEEVLGCAWSLELKEI